MHQLSFFTAESEPPEPADLAGLLAGPGQCVLSGDKLSQGTGRISVVVDDLWRAEAIAELMAQCALPGRRISTEIGRSEEGRPLVRTELAPELLSLGRSWVKGAAKNVPDGWVPSSRAQRVWALAAGRGEDGHYLLGLDPARARDPRAAGGRAGSGGHRCGDDWTARRRAGPADNWASSHGPLDPEHW